MRLAVCRSCWEKFLFSLIFCLLHRFVSLQILAVRREFVGGSQDAHTAQRVHGTRMAQRPTSNVTKGDQPKNWKATTREPSRPGLFPNAHALDNAGGVHVGKDDFDVGTGDQVKEYDDLWWVRPDGRQTWVTNECKSVHDATMMCKDVMNATETFNST